MSDAEDVRMTTVEVAALLRITFRQLDYWVRSGWLVPRLQGRGTGVRRLWSAQEVERARAFAALVHAGVQPMVVAKSADTMLAGPDWFAARLGTLTVTGPLP